MALGVHNWREVCDFTFESESFDKDENIQLLRVESRTAK